MGQIVNNLDQLPNKGLAPGVTAPTASQVLRRKSDNTGWEAATIADPDLSGLMPKAGGTFTGDVKFHTPIQSAPGHPFQIVRNSDGFVALSLGDSDYVVEIASLTVGAYGARSAAGYWNHTAVPTTLYNNSSLPTVVGANSTSRSDASIDMALPTWFREEVRIGPSGGYTPLFVQGSVQTSYSYGFDSGKASFGDSGLAMYDGRIAWRVSTFGAEDTRLRRTAASELTLDDGAAGAANLVVTGAISPGILDTGTVPGTSNGQYVTDVTTGKLNRWNGASWIEIG